MNADYGSCWHVNHCDVNFIHWIRILHRMILRFFKKSYINGYRVKMKSYYLTIDHWHLILQKSYPFSSSCWILMSRSECRRTKWSSSCPSKLSSSSQLPKIHHLLLLNRHQGVGLPEGSNFQSQYLWMCHPWRWTRRLVWVVFIYNLNWY